MKILPVYEAIRDPRTYSNDAPPQTALMKRVGMAAMPIISLFAPLPVSIAMSALRAYNSQDQDTLSKLISMIALAGTFFQYKFAVAVTTTHDTLIEIQKVAQAKTWEEASNSLFKITHHLVELALLSQGGIPLSILAYSLQSAVNLLDSKEEFQKGRWIEGVAQLLMGGVRMTQCHALYGDYKQQEAMKAALQQLLENTQPSVELMTTHEPTKEVYCSPTDKHSIHISETQTLDVSYSEYKPLIWVDEPQGWPHYGGRAWQEYLKNTFPVICIKTPHQKQWFLYCHVEYSERHDFGQKRLKLDDYQMLNIPFKSLTGMTFNTDTMECYHPELGTGKWKYDVDHWNGVCHLRHSMSLSIDFEPNGDSVMDKMLITKKSK